MNQINEDVVTKLIGKIYRDTMIIQSPNYFITHRYKAEQFQAMMEPHIFHSVIGFLPNTKYRGVNFIMSVTFNKATKEYEVTVHNPKLKF